MTTLDPKLPFEQFVAPNEKVESANFLLQKRDSYALWGAYAAGRPLLLRGKPGTGKSQMAKAIAQQLGWVFVSEVIHGNTELSDLHWHFDAIGRLGEAQVHGDHETVRENLQPKKFLSPGAFWWAYHWESAEDQFLICPTRLRQKPQQPEGWTKEKGGVVLLIDEIDKADPDLPNGLLETLGAYQFSVPYVDHEESQQDNSKDNINPIVGKPEKLLVIITTNEERELPNAFIRRCFVHELEMEISDSVIDRVKHQQLGWALSLMEGQFLEKRHLWLMERGKLHFNQTISDQLYYETAAMLWKDRDKKIGQKTPPGLAEYIDLLNAISTLNRNEQAPMLRKIAEFALKKSKGI